jgi:hypothetical protein
MKKAARGSMSRTTKKSAAPKVPNVTKALDAFYKTLRRTAPPLSSPTKHKGKLVNPFVEGVTYSSLSLFDIDKAAYHANYGCGWTNENPGDGLKFGQFFHDLIDRYDGQKIIPTAGQCLHDLEPRRIRLVRSARTQQDADSVDILVGFAAAMFPSYLAFWNDPANSVFPDDLTDAHIDWLGREEKFRFEHPGVPGKPPIPHNGRRDGRFRFKSQYARRAPGVRQVLMETKTFKARFTPTKTKLDMMCHEYAQVCIYSMSMLHDPKVAELPSHVLYHVIKRPEHQRRTGRATKANGMKKIAESIPEFVERVRADVASRPGEFFIRSFREQTEETVASFVQYQLNPVLKDLVDHWESIQSNPEQPHLVVRGDGAKAVNFEHRSRFKGIFDPEEAGLDRALFDPLTANSRVGLVVRDAPFPELVDE